MEACQIRTGVNFNVGLAVMRTIDSTGTKYCDHLAYIQARNNYPLKVPSTYIKYIYIYMCVCVCVCARARARVYSDNLVHIGKYS